MLDLQRQLYKAALQERVGAWRWEHRSVTRFEQFRQLTGWDHPVLQFGISPARGTLTRVDRALQGFYRRCHSGETPGFPRFKGRGRFDSVEYPDPRCWQIVNEHRGVGRLHLKGIGAVRFRGAKRGVLGVPKTITVRREGSRWRVTVFCADVPARHLEPTGRHIGIDVGVTELVATSDGELIGNPRHLRRSLVNAAISLTRSRVDSSTATT
jgi:putative transposase